MSSTMLTSYPVVVTPLTVSVVSAAVAMIGSTVGLTGELTDRLTDGLTDGLTEDRSVVEHPTDARFRKHNIPMGSAHNHGRRSPLHMLTRRRLVVAT